MDDNVEIIRSNKGGMKLIHRGYMYTVHKKRQSGGIRWRCTQRSLHCKGSISTGNGPPKVNMPHNHIPDPHAVALAKCRQFEEFADLTPLVETECDEVIEEPRVNRAAENASPTALKESDADEVCLRWNSHHNNMKTSFPSLLQREQYVDVTLASEGKMLKCHRLILSSCSAYFDEILSGISPLQHPVIFVNGVEFWILKSLIDFMYAGEVHIEQNKLPHLLKVAETLQIKGLAGKSLPPDEDEAVVKTEIPAVPIVEEPFKTTPKKIVANKETGDPLSLLQPTTFVEEPFKTTSKKIVPKKMRKRKSSEHEVSPPRILFRKGTKSRPHVKVPRYYHNDYEDVKTPKQEEPDTYDVNKIKSEPLDIEDTDVRSYDDDKRRSNQTDDCVKDDTIDEDPLKNDCHDEVGNKNDND